MDASDLPASDNRRVEASTWHGTRTVRSDDNDVARRRAYAVVALALLGQGSHADQERRIAPQPAAEAITEVQMEAGVDPASDPRDVEAST